MTENKVDTGYWVDWMITHQMGEHKIGKTKWAKASIELLLVDCGAPISAIRHPVVILLTSPVRGNYLRISTFGASLHFFTTSELNLLCVGLSQGGHHQIIINNDFNINIVVAFCLLHSAFYLTCIEPLISLFTLHQGDREGSQAETLSHQNNQNAAFHIVHAYALEPRF